MNPIECSVSIHPYFKVHSGKMDTVKALLHEFIARTATEEKALYYEFTINGDLVFCREAYVGAEGALAHLANVGAQLDKMLTLSEVTRLDNHGPRPSWRSSKVRSGSSIPRGSLTSAA